MPNLEGKIEIKMQMKTGKIKLAFVTLILFGLIFKVRGVDSRGSLLSV
jgi:hypothetical protein